jgi:hypothetical protein
MKEIIINNKPIFESLINKKSKERANIVFNKLLAQQKKPKNPFDEARTQSYPATNLKSGGNINESI